MIPFVSFSRKYRRYEKPIQSAIGRVLKRGWFILGPELAKFESLFAAYLGVKYAVGVNSGTDALFLALKALGVRSGHEVITVSNTATPTISAIRMAGATPVFADVSADTCNIDCSLLERAISSRTRAIVPVHLFGYPAGMREVLRIAKRHHLPVVEDACQAHGAKYRGRMVGTLANLGCFSFYPTKNLGAFGDAGAVVTNSKRLADRLRALRNYGEVAKFKNACEGVNSRMDELQAALLSWGLSHLDEWNQRRTRIAHSYLHSFRDLPLRLPPVSDSICDRVWHLFVVQTDRRDELKEFLLRRGIETIVHYPTPVHMQPAFRFLRQRSSDLPVATALAKRVLSLPLYPDMTMDEVSKISGTVLEFHGREPKLR